MSGCSEHPRRSPADLEQVGQDPAYLGGIGDERDELHLRATLGTGHDFQFVHLGKQPCPGFPAGARADFLILRGIRGLRRLNGLSAILVHRRASAEGGNDGSAGVPSRGRTVVVNDGGAITALYHFSSTRDRAGQGGRVLSRRRLAAGRSTALRPFPPRDPEGFELSFTVDAIP